MTLETVLKGKWIDGDLTYFPNQMEGDKHSETVIYWFIGRAEEEACLLVLTV